MLHYLKDLVLTGFDWLRCAIGAHDYEEREVRFLWSDTSVKLHVCKNCEHWK